MFTKTPVSKSLIILSILLVGVVGCTRPSTPSAVLPTVPPTPTLPPSWETRTASADQGQCAYTISHPSDVEVASQGTYSWILSSKPTTDPNEPIRNFIYISVIPDGFPRSGSEPGIIYNYDPAETQILLNMQVGESRSVRDDPYMADWFTYTRRPDTTLSNQTAQAYENTQPWEFPLGTKEIRYYLQANGCTYLIGGYMATVGSGQRGATDEELFDQIIATFRLAP